MYCMYLLHIYFFFFLCFYTFAPSTSSFDWAQIHIGFNKLQNTLRKVLFFSPHKTSNSTDENETLPLTIYSPLEA